MIDHHDFEVRLGRIRSRGARGRTFVADVLRAANKAGLVAGVIARPVRTSRGRGRAAFLASRLAGTGRRVVVKARVVRHIGRQFRAAPLATHIAYLKREGVDRSGAPGALFDASGEAEARRFAERCEDDRHHFRFIVSPEDAAQLGDLRAFTRDLMRQAERDLDTRLDWIAVDHWNTGHPHVHILVRGVGEDGSDLVIDRDYISRGLRARAEALVALELGPRTSREIAEGLERDAAAGRWTRLDQLLVAVSQEGRVDLRPGAGGERGDVRPLLLARAAVLERLGLASAVGPGVWRLSDRLEENLRGLSVRNDIIATLHRFGGADRPTEALDLHGEAAEAPIVGRLAARGLSDELSGQAFVVIDGVDGRLHHVRAPDLGAAGDTPVGGIVEVGPGRSAGDVRVLHRSDLDLTAQVDAEGATWLDRRLLAQGRTALAWTGFGQEVRRALAARTARLASLGLAHVTSGGVTFADGLIATLRAREIARAAAVLSEATGLDFHEEGAEPGPVRGRYLRRVDLASGRFAMVEDGLGFRLLPWARALDRQLGREVSGTPEAGGMSWDLGRRRGPAR